ncbi:MAG: ABC transporter ATP-binding protein [Chloroflexi bacterium]|nr:ABC transporter ATP-binding protein [Chloroflexota bacterium]
MTNTIPVARPHTRGTIAPAVRIEGVTYRYGERVALDDLSLDIPAGAIFGLLGPNGCGKSTLLTLLIGRREAASGAVTLLGEPMRPALRRSVGIVFQEGTLDPGMTVAETMHLQARMFGIATADARRETERLLDRVGLSDRANAMTATLSGGMRRRLELARALLPRPDLLLLDEPTLALDPDSRQALWEHLLEANAAGCTLLLATNDVHEAERYCREVALLDHGRLVARGTPADLKRDLRHDAVRIEWKSAAPPPSLHQIRDWPGVGSVREAGRITHVTVDDASVFLTQLFAGSGSAVQGVTIEESTLEDVYFQLVGHGITSRADVTEAQREAHG